MVTLLSRIFIKNKNVNDPQARGAWGVLCGILGICLNLLLCAGKLIAGLVSGSISIVADAFNNLSDAGSSVITLLGFKMAAQKPDYKHPFGHGRMEYISGLLVSLIIVIVGFELGKSSVEKIITPEPTEFSWVSVIVLSGAILVKLYMSFYNSRIGRKIDSAAMCATATDSLTDSVATGVVLICTLLAGFTSLQLDAYCGLCVSAFILYAGVRSAIDTVSPLLGSMPSAEFVDDVERIVCSHEIILGIHDLIVHDYGPGRRMISLHAEVPANGNLLQMHDEIDNAEEDLRRQLQCDAVIHMDPVENDNEEVCALHEKVKALVAGIEPSLKIHDFRIVPGPSHTNLVFDVLVSYKCLYFTNRFFLTNFRFHIL